MRLDVRNVFGGVLWVRTFGRAAARPDGHAARCSPTGFAQWPTHCFFLLLVGSDARKGLARQMSELVVSSDSDFVAGFACSFSSPHFCYSVSSLLSSSLYLSSFLFLHVLYFLSVSCDLIVCSLDQPSLCFCVAPPLLLLLRFSSLSLSLSLSLSFSLTSLVHASSLLPRPFCPSLHTVFIPLPSLSLSLHLAILSCIHVSCDPPLSLPSLSHW